MGWVVARGPPIVVCRLKRSCTFQVKVDPRSESDETPLIMAARAKHRPVVDTLLDVGAWYDDVRYGRLYVPRGVVWIVGPGSPVQDKTEAQAHIGGPPGA